MEGDSPLIIGMAKRIQRGHLATSMSDNWRLEFKLQLLVNEIAKANAMTFKHVLQMGNKLADGLEPALQRMRPVMGTARAEPVFQFS